MVHIYVLIDPGTQEIRYVGQTFRDLEVRLISHLKYRGRDHRTAWVQSLCRRGLKPEIRFLQDVDHDHRAEAERYWISYFREHGCDLTNGTDGGEGCWGYKHTPEARRLMAKKRQGKPPTRLGAIASDETRAKISAATKRQMADPVQREMVSKVHRGKVISEEHRQSVGVAATKRWVEWRASGAVTSDETRAKISASHKGRPGNVPSPEGRERIAQAKREWWAARKATG